MKTRTRELLEQGDKLFEKKRPLDSMWQDIAENFYPERADFTTTRALGEEFASHLMTGRPVLARRDLANSLSSMLRPRGQPWFHCRTGREEINKDVTAKRWLDGAADVLRRVMYDPRAQFIRATKEGDNDFAAFGQTVISVDRNRTRDGLLYRCWHLRDCAWRENAERVINVFNRKWQVEACELHQMFPKTVSDKVKKLLEKEPYREIQCRHIVIPTEQYDYSKSNYADAPPNKRKLPFMSIYVDKENETILEEIPVPALDYVIPRWVTISGSQYAYSPSVVVATPDARMLQKIGLSIMEAAEIAVSPPMKAVGEMISGGVNYYAGGVTWVDADYDERTGSAMEPMNIDTRGLNFGVMTSQRVEQMISEAFFLNKINLPDMGGDKTAYEVQKMVEEYIRQALPLFEPMEIEYNGGLCEKSFELVMRMGGFGSPDNIPPVLGGQELRFQFESPLQAASERAKATAFTQAGDLLRSAMELDPSVRHDYDMRTAVRDAISGVGAPADWQVPREEADKAIAAERQQQAENAQAQRALQGVAQVADVAGKAGVAAQQLQAAGVA